MRGLFFPLSSHADSGFYDRFGPPVVRTDTEIRMSEAGPGREGQGGRAREGEPGREGQGGRAREGGPGRESQGGRAREGGPGREGQEGGSLPNTWMLLN